MVAVWAVTDVSGIPAVPAILLDLIAGPKPLVCKKMRQIKGDSGCYFPIETPVDVRQRPWTCSGNRFRAFFEVDGVIMHSPSIFRVTPQKQSQGKRVSNVIKTGPFSIHAP